MDTTGESMTASRQDIVREARRLIGTKARDHFDLLSTIAKRLSIIDQATLERHDSRGEMSAFASLRRCVVSRRFGVQIPLGKIEAGDFCTTVVVTEEYFTENPNVPFRLEADQVMIVSEMSPRTYIFIDPQTRLVVEEARDFKLSRAFRLRQRVDLALSDEMDIIKEHAQMAQRLLMQLEVAKYTGKPFRFDPF